MSGTGRWRRGLTLVEVAVVLFILALAAGLAAPAVGGSRSARTAGGETATQIVGLLTDVRMLALRRARVARLTLDPESARYWITIDAPDGWTVLKRDSVRLARGIRLDGDSPRVVWAFSPDGTAAGGPIVVRDGAGATVVAVDPIAGEPHVEDR